MARRLLPVVATLLTCLSAFSVSAADKDNPLPETSSERRVQVDTQRERITGADSAAQKTPGGAQTIVDAPIETADAPAGNEKR
ncbi:MULTISPECIES: hypothetical protein [Pseudomonas syringae group]|nr:MULTISPECIES: hypothetical protein [Pseudomonas syringae group]KAA8718576.1 hypothetical protein F4W70_02905 [Pseudomonas cannabina]KPB75632.1 Uncharacterized protein AC507_2652 [Pseudomonas syringae pv. maculicola]KPC28400.1 Uncharacterized protein ABJ99_3557 [Pseudomonas syringae pv. cilantro]KPW26641.1 Uncharacterized protein ALO83_02276 [Pseudomonas cannabina pv. alisalensis]KPW62686.1 Uncharacterized protein ALO81_01192 [Pseudomonas cannabina]